jgi:hypothetical protein
MQKQAQRYEDWAKVLPSAKMVSSREIVALLKLRK